MNPEDLIYCCLGILESRRMRSIVSLWRSEEIRRRKKRSEHREMLVVRTYRRIGGDWKEGILFIRVESECRSSETQVGVTFLQLGIVDKISE